MRQRVLLAAEFLLLFGGLPLLILFEKNRGLMILTAWLGAALVWYVLHRKYGRAHAHEWNMEGFKAGIRAVCKRFFVLAPPIALLAWLIIPENFLALPRERTELWIKIMFFYPVLSVWPQEIIYRSFLYHRYAPLFGQGRGFIAASSLSFAFMHIMFLNPVALFMTAIGGYLFASDYARHKSLALACLEHTLYGCLVFTVGLGVYFYSGNAWGN